jgi:hypothetical protein
VIVLGGLPAGRDGAGQLAGTVLWVLLIERKPMASDA